jgi:hypothetical protein
MTTQNYCHPVVRVREFITLRSIILKIIISSSSKRHAACAHKQQILIEGDNLLCASFSFSPSLSSLLFSSLKREHRLYFFLSLPSYSYSRCRYLRIRSFLLLLLCILLVVVDVRLAYRSCSLFGMAIRC